MKLPSKIYNLIANKNIKEITDFHVSGDNVFMIEDEFILKVSTNIGRLKKEYEKDKWFSNVLSTPKPILYIIEEDKAYYLRECIDGENLCSSKYLENPQLLINLLKEALDMFHNVDASNCPFIVGEGNTIIHGDFCLPNILVKDNKISGFIDIGDAGVGDAWCDYAWCIWSMEYNLKTKEYTPQLLRKLKIEFDEEKFLKYTKD